MMMFTVQERLFNPVASYDVLPPDKGIYTVEPNVCSHDNTQLVYSSGHFRRWRSRMEVKIMAVPLFAHCKIAYLTRR